MKKKYVIFLVCIILALAMIIMTIPIIYNDYDAKCEDVIKFNFDRKYITRKEFYELIFRSMGADDRTFYGYHGVDFYTSPVKDMPLYDFHEYSIIALAASCGMLEGRYKFDIEFMDFDLIFDGDKYITLKEAIVILQSALEEFKNGGIWIYDKEFRRLYTNAKESGVLNDKDLITRIPIDRLLSQKECKILLSRFLNLNMYRYISDNDIYENNSQITYFDYLKSIR